MEAETGAVLYAKGMDAQRYPASLTKIMTALLQPVYKNRYD